MSSHLVRDTRNELRPFIRVVAFVCVAVIGLIVDQLTKALAVGALGHGKVITLIPHFLQLRLLYNAGASLSLASAHTSVIGIFAIVACLVLLVLQFRTTSMAWSVVLGVAFAGAAGNLIDRVAYAQSWFDGKVIDFLDYGWSVGNVADIFLALAAIGIIVLMLKDVPFRITHRVHEDSSSE